MADFKQIPHGIARELTRPMLGLFESMISAINTKIDEIIDGIEDNIVVFDAEGRAKDSEKNIPIGEVVGTTDTQTLTHKTLTTPTIGNFTNATHDHADNEGGGTIDHGALTGAGDDDHTQYHNNTRGDARYLYRENSTAFTPDADYEPATKKYVDDTVVTDHGGLSGLSDDDHTQYHNNARGDARYTPIGNVAATQNDASTASGDPADLTEAVTKTEFDNAVGVINALIDKLQAAGLMT